MSMKKRKAIYKDVIDAVARLLDRREIPYEIGPIWEGYILAVPGIEEKVRADVVCHEWSYGLEFYATYSSHDVIANLSVNEAADLFEVWRQTKGTMILTDGTDFLEQFRESGQLLDHRGES